MKALSACLALSVGASVVGTALPAAAAPHEPSVRAVVTVATGAPLPLTVPGVKVRNVFSRIGVEVVTGSPSALWSLAHTAGVVGVTPDRHGRVAGDDGSDENDARGVFAADQLGGKAGQPGTGAGVNVALLDTGVSDTRALSRDSGRITNGVDVSQLNSPNGTADTDCTCTDGYGHGTFLASLIAGGRVPGSGKRAIGVAPAARIVVVKVADAQGNTSLSEVLAGLDWVAAHAQGINVVNLALAVDRPTGSSYGADPLTAAVEHVRAAGVVVVAAAGNKPGEVGDPGLDPQALTVGAADVSGDPKVAPFSGSGTVAGVAKPDIVAPGVHVLGVINSDSQIAANHPEGRVGKWLFKGSGTSEATAITTGVVAAYLSEHPDASALQVKSALRRQAQGMSDSRAGSGLVQMVTGSGGTASTTAAGEASWDRAAWNANAWTGVPGWQTQLQSMWSGPAWDAISWSAITWSAISWSNSNWSAISWSAISWSAISWSAISWSAISWSAISWSDYGWGDA